MFYTGEVWFVVVVSVTAVISLVLVTLLVVRCCCRRQPPYVRQRLPLDQSPPSYRYHDNRYRDNDYDQMLADKLAVRKTTCHVQCRDVGSWGRVNSSGLETCLSHADTVGRR